MNKKQLIATITALEDSSRVIANSEEVSEKMRNKATGECIAYSQIINMLKSPKFAREVAEIYGVNI